MTDIFEWQKEEEKGLTEDLILERMPFFLQHNYRNKQYLTFEPITFVPIQSKMIDPTLLTEKEVWWLLH